MGAMSDVTQVESTLLSTRRRYGARATIALVSVFGSLSSVLLCSLVYLVVGFPHGTENVLVGFGLPLMIPLLTAPPALSLVLRAQQRSEDLLSQVTYLVSHDPLTEVLNRRGFLSVMADVGPGWHLVVVDVDDFKSVNDVLGHAVGDAVLQSVAARLSDRLGPRAHVARFGGDEFVAAAPPGVVAGLMPLPTRFRVVIPEPGEAPRRQVTCSLGSAVVQSGEQPEAALARADAALYDVKRSKSVGEPA